MPDDALALKEAGNAAFKAGDYAAAVQSYTRAAEAAAGAPEVAALRTPTWPSSQWTSLELGAGTALNSS